MDGSACGLWLANAPQVCSLTHPQTNQPHLTQARWGWLNQPSTTHSTEYYQPFWQTIIYSVCHWQPWQPCQLYMVWVNTVFRLARSSALVESLPNSSATQPVTIATLKSTAVNAHSLSTAASAVQKSVQKSINELTTCLANITMLMNGTQQRENVWNTFQRPMEALPSLTPHVVIYTVTNRHGCKIIIPCHDNNKISLHSLLTLSAKLCIHGIISGQVCVKQRGGEEPSDVKVLT